VDLSSIKYRMMEIKRILVSIILFSMLERAIIYQLQS